MKYFIISIKRIIRLNSLKTILHIQSQVKMEQDPNSSRFNYFNHLIFAISIFQVFNLVYGQTDGFYKDLFMDGGVELTSRTTLPAADALGLEWEYIATSSENMQSEIMIENEWDQNGLLLYPDGAPRYAMIYTNGGSATNHGNSLGEVGRDRVREFYNHGGSYSGSCAGAYIASRSYMTSGTYTPYYHIWPGRTEPTNLENTYTGHFISDQSPLLNYFDFGGDSYIADVYHNGGCTIRENIDFPPGTEVLLRYDYPDMPMHNRPSCWAYKENEQSGRVVVIGSHPEGATSGEPYNLMQAIILYALDGCGRPVLKGELQNGQTRFMNKSTNDNDPSFTKLGDKQYHHYKIEIPVGSNNLKIKVNSADSIDLSVFLKQGDFAFSGSAGYQETGTGDDLVLSIPDIPPGDWYASVKCETTVKTVKQSWGYSYSENRDILNGVAYSIMAEWDTTATSIVADNLIPVQFQLEQNYPNPFNPSTTIAYTLPTEGTVELSVFDVNGRLVKVLRHGVEPAGSHAIRYDAGPLSSGIYFYQLKFESENILNKRMIKVD
jgi:glutamine amidotransferase-like uncharacterized protein